MTYLKITENHRKNEVRPLSLSLSFFTYINSSIGGAIRNKTQNKSHASNNSNNINSSYTHIRRDVVNVLHSCCIAARPYISNFCIWEIEIEEKHTQFAHAWAPNALLPNIRWNDGKKCTPTDWWILLIRCSNRM